ncbi:hypothetical protein [Sphingobacterium multivorum]|uniref:hypothetical protein n=1 Tax=Sphingobacterium multivorum TaxID=28454 RepID=UPI003DA57005
MEKIKFSELLRLISISDTRLYPFCDDFENNVTGILDPVIKDVYKNEVIYDQEGIELVKIFITLNELYKELGKLISDAIQRTGLDLDGFTKSLSSFCNGYCLSVIKQQLSTGEDSELNNLHHLTQIPAGQLKNENGQEVNINDVMDNVADTCSELLSFFVNQNIHPEIGEIPAESERLESILFYLLQTGTILYSYKQEFEKFQWEEIALKLEGENIVFKSDPPNYHFLKFANRHREFAGVFQAFGVGQNMTREHKEGPSVEITDEGWITFNDAIKERISIQDSSTSIFVNFYFHLHLSDTETQDLKVNGILDFVVAIEQLFVRCLQKNQTVRPVAFRIKHTDLLSYINILTGQSTQIIEMLIGQFSCTVSSKIDIWRKPLIAQEGYYCFFYPTITFGAFSSRFENLLSFHMSKTELNRKFTGYISLELSKPNKKALFNLVDSELYKTAVKADNILVYESDRTIVILKAVMLKYCLTPSECFNTLTLIHEYNDEFLKERDIIKKRLEETSNRGELNVLSAIVTNHYQFSGMNIGETILLDPSILVNYVVVGKYSKSIMMNDFDLHRSEEIASYYYYDDEESFNKNLARLFSMPAPLEELINNLTIETIKISPKTASPAIFTDIVRMESLKNTIEDTINELKTNFRQLHYFEIDYNRQGMQESKELIEQRIQYLLPMAFSYFAMNRSDRNSRIRLLDIFKEFGILSVANLIFGLHAQIENLAKKRIEKTIPVKIGSFDRIKGEKHLEEIMSKMLAGKSSSLSTINIEHGLSEKDTDNLINYLLDIAASFTPKKYTDGELTGMYTIITLVANLTISKEKYEPLIYSICENYIATLNYNGHYQQARDTAEEILAFSLKYQTYPLLGWLCLFKCFTTQKNALDGCFYGILYFSALNSTPIIKDYQAFDGLYNAFIYYRNFHYHKLSDSLYASLQSFELSEYDLQKITLSYFYSLISSPERTRLLFPQVEDFLMSHKDSIIGYGHQGCYPWMAFFYNLMNLESAGTLKLSDFLWGCIAEFEQQIYPETLEELKATAFSVPNETANLLRTALKKANETRDIEDYVSELSNLELLANNLIRDSVNTSDLESLLLAGLVINDPTLTFEHKESEGFTKLSFGDQKDEETPFVNYAENIISKLDLKDGDVICWIFEYSGKFAVLFINDLGEHSITKMDNWDLELMKSWLSQGLNAFVFNEVRASINEQEQDYIKSLQELQFSTIKIPFECRQLFVYTSIEIASFPKNLLLFEHPLQSDTFNKHQDIVKEYIRSADKDFISFHKPITDIISIERYAKYGKDKELSFRNLRVEAWVPVDDQDMALFIAYTRMRAPLSDYQCEIRCELIPNPPLNGHINFIAAHGEKSGEGFKAVHTKEGEDGHAIINGPGTEYVFGKGMIAVVFICNSGFQSKKIYSQALTSFVNQLIGLGYESVIAPAWKYNPEMCGIWTETFLNALKSGVKLSWAVYHANHVTSQKGFDEYWGFYAPSGWASMHLYGNPNIYFS